MPDPTPTPDDRFFNRFKDDATPTPPGLSSISISKPSASDLARQVFFNTSGTSDEEVLNTLRSMGQRASDAEIEALRRKRNPFSRMLLSGNDWGAMDHAPYFNPVKAVFGGLGWWQKNINDPLSGIAVAGPSLFLDKTFGQSDYETGIRDAAGELVRDPWTVSGWANLWSTAGDFNRDRPQLFPAEKFITAMVFDPLNVVGFGWLGKIPVAGKVLGPLEHGYIAAVDTPFRKLATGFTIPGVSLRVPGFRDLLRTPTQYAQAVGDDAFTSTTAWLTHISDGLPPRQIPQAKVSSELARILAPGTRRHQLSTPAQKVFDLLYEEPVFQPGGLRIMRPTSRGHQLFQTPEGVGEWVSAAGGNAALASPDIPMTTDWLISFTDTVVNFTKRRPGYSLGEAANRIIRLSGGNPENPFAVTEVKRLLTDHAERKLARIKSNVLELNGTRLREYLATQSERIHAQNLALGSAIFRYRQGAIGGVLNEADRFYSAILRDKVQRHVIHPLASAMLAFPAFPLQEAFESYIRMATGGAGYGFLKLDEAARAFSLYNVPASLLRADVEPVATRGVLEGTLAGGIRLDTSEHPFESAANKILDSIFAKSPEIAKNSRAYTRKLKWLDPREYRNSAGRMTVAMKNAFLHTKMYQHLTEMWKNEGYDGLLTTLDSFPKDFINGKTRQRIQEKAVIAASTGNVDAVRHIADDYTVEIMSKRELAAAVDESLDLAKHSPDAVDSIHEFIQTDRTVNELPSFMEEVRQKDWEAFRLGPEGIRVAFDHAVESLRDNPPENIHDLLSMINKVNDLTFQFNRSLENLNKSTWNFMERRQMTSAQRARLWENTSRMIDETVSQMESNQQLIQDVIGNAERRTLRYSTFAGEFNTDISRIGNAWRRAKRLQEELFAANQGPKGDSFWREFRRVMDDHWTEVSKARLEGQIRRDALRDRVLTRAGLQPSSRVSQFTPRDFSNKTKLTVKDVADIVGRDHESITQALVGAAYYNKADFVRYVRIRGEALGRTGFKDDQVAKVYDDVLHELGITEDMHDAFLPIEMQLDNLETEMRSRLKAPLFGERQVQALKDFLETVVSEVERLGSPSVELEQLRPSDILRIRTEFLDRLQGGLTGREDFDALLAPLSSSEELNLLDEGIRDVLAARRKEFDSILGRDSQPFLTLDERGEIVVSPDTRDEFHKLIGRERLRRNIQTAIDSANNDLTVLRERRAKLLASPGRPAERAFDVRTGLTPRELSQTAEFRRVNVAARAALKEKSQLAVNKAVEDLKHAFVNYGDQTVVDHVMKFVFPFYTYEARRLPWLTRVGLTHPAVWQLFSPEGAYVEHTNDSYIQAPFMSWMDINFLGGTMFNTPRRLFRAEYPPQHDQGIGGLYSRWEQQVGRYGFYFGAHITGVMELINALSGQNTPELGAALPPPVTGIMAGLEATNVPILSDLARGARNQLFHDRFREWQTARILMERGLPVDEFDDKTFSPIPGATHLTQSDIHSASLLAARMEAISEAIGNVRFIGPRERNVRDITRKINKMYTGLSDEELDQLRRDGVSVWDVIAMPPQVSDLLGEVNGADELHQANMALLGGERRQIAERATEMWRTYHRIVDSYREEQTRDDAAWLRGEITPRQWRINNTDRRTKRSNTLLTLRGRVRIPNSTESRLADPTARYAEVPVTYDDYVAMARKYGYDTIPLRHHFDELLEGYYSIIPQDRNNDGELEYGKFYKERSAYIDKLPGTVKKLFLQYIERNRTDVEAALDRARRGILGKYWNIEDDVLAEYADPNNPGKNDLADLIADYNRAKFRDQDLAKDLHAGIRPYEREVRRRKEEMRANNPELDYILNVFGFTGSQGINFVTDEARQWWDEGNFTGPKRPDLSRIH